VIELYFDEDNLKRALIRGLRLHSVELTTAQEQGMRSATDAEQLAFAARAGRALVTSNVAHFARLHVEYLSTGRHHAGIIVIRQQRMRLGEQLRRLLLLVHTKSAAEMIDALEYLSQWGN
jgi:predicted nuclease of predicted toxin-antitoxin system